MRVLPFSLLLIDLQVYFKLIRCNPLFLPISYTLVASVTKSLALQSK